MSRAFQRTIENFTCGHCGRAVAGNGYTNHCPACLYSRHVDINPGDRASQCGGLMEPVAIEISGQEWFVVQRCVACGFTRRNKLSPDDDRETAIALAGRRPSA